MCIRDSCTAYAVIRNPTNEGLVHTALVNQVFNKTPNRVISNCRYNGSPVTETALESAGDVVFAAFFRDPRVAYAA